MEGQSYHVAFYAEHIAAEDHWGWWGCEANPPRQQAAVARGTLLVLQDLVLLVPASSLISFENPSKEPRQTRTSTMGI